MFLLIQNKGVAAIEAFTLLGDSATRNCGVSGVIGQFGSGTKHAINLLLRKGIEFYIYSGKTRLEFFYEIDRVQDAHGDHEVARVKCKLSGDKNRTIDCGWVLDFGAIDWTDTHMALREFVSNAIDCTKQNDDEEGLAVCPEGARRAKAGHTRVFIDWHNEDVQEFYQNLSVRFLHFAADPTLVDQRFIENRHGGGPRVYREGVLIQELRSPVSSVFDYNFKSSEIAIDECRNSSEYSLKAAMGQALGQADKGTLKQLFSSSWSSPSFEACLDEYYMSYYANQENVKVAWNEAWEELVGDAVVASEAMASSPIAEHVQRKGFKVVTLPDNLVTAAKKMGVRDVVSVLGEAAAAGKVETATTREAEAAVAEVWGWCETAGLTCGKAQPATKCFKEIMDAEGECLGYYEPGSEAVHIREDVGGKLALKTAIEEVTHYITGSRDGSRDLQNFAFDMIVELCT